ncbi:MAG: tRNA (adenosine(37)-N6)-dimethylallyltransferase MiaA [Hyphomicrobium sp.]|nr:tRNA (adenosine(37)-N6)-dimethylallyltransferase MiaA [Hyphomicrobium sp.]
MSDMRPILIAGPTASGKSGLALRLAEHLGGVVINADSMQVYRELRVLTARPGPEEEARAPHALYGFVSGRESYSAGRYAIDVAGALAEAQRAGRRPIIVGGTGLYFKTLVEGLSPIPGIPQEVRAHWRAEAAEKGAAHVHAALAARDTDMAQRLAPGDTQRIVRALEVLDATGLSLAEWQRMPRQPVLDLAATVPLAVDVERAELWRRIDARFVQMMQQGALDEVLQLEALGLDPTLPIMTALGVRPLLRHLAGELSRADAVAAGQAETRQYAKRQATWVRSNMIAWRRISTHEMEMSAGDFVSFVQSPH